MTTVACLCPPRADGTPRHIGGDTITLRDKLGFRAVTTIRWALTLLRQDDPDATTADVMALLTEQYVLQGVEAWTVVDAKGTAMAVTPANLRAILLTRSEEAQAVGDEADERYSEVILPLLVRASASSPATPTDGSTSASPSTPTPLPKRSRRSSTSTIPMDVTGTIISSPAGGSSSSASSGTAA